MRKRNSLPLLLLGLAFFSIPDASAQNIPSTVQRFACRNIAYTNYLTVQGLTGFGNQSRSVYASVEPKNNNMQFRSAGYVLTPNSLQPPSAVTGFQNLSAQVMIANSPTAINDGRVEFTFQFAAGAPQVFTKTFNQMNPTGGNTKTISATNADFPIAVSTANLTKVVIYITRNTGQSFLFLGKCDVNTGQGKYKVNTLLTPEAGCQ